MEIIAKVWGKTQPHEAELQICKVYFIHLQEEIREISDVLEAFSCNLNTMR